VVGRSTGQGGGKGYRTVWWEGVQDRVVERSTGQGGGKGYRTGWWEGVQDRVVGRVRKVREEIGGK
jgi:hypothetical protein